MQTLYKLRNNHRCNKVDTDRQKDSRCNQPSDQFPYQCMLLHKSLQDHQSCLQELDSCCHIHHLFHLQCTFEFQDLPMLGLQRTLHRLRLFDVLRLN